jgi:hypothetical protein
MKIDRRLTLLGVMLVILSMTMATQYATTKVGYRYSIVHPSEADIRFIGSDNSSGGRVLRVNTNTTANRYMILELGNWSPSENKSYSAAFGIVNEESFPVNITYANVSGAGVSGAYIDILLHSNRKTDAWGDTKCWLVDSGSARTTSNTCAWKLGAGDGDASTCDAGATPWDNTAHVRFSTDNATAATNGTSDFVWVQVTIDLPADAADLSGGTGQIWIHFKASTL